MFIVRDYWGFQPNPLLILVTHLLLLTHIPRQGIVAPAYALRTASNNTQVSCPSYFRVLCSIDSITGGVAATPFTLSILRFNFSGTFGTRDLNLRALYYKPVFIFLLLRDTQFG